jgi:hypothetical protein
VGRNLGGTHSALVGGDQRQPAQIDRLKLHGTDVQKLQLRSEVPEADTPPARDENSSSRQHLSVPTAAHQRIRVAAGRASYLAAMQIRSQGFVKR